MQGAQNQIAIKQAAEAMQKLGMALPCQVTAVSGSIVSVSFQVTSPWTLPEITIPKAEGQWIRSPTQVGDYGMTIQADVYLGGVSGLGGGTANDTRRGNLTSLVWVPVAATSFPAAPNANAVYLNGPAGAVIQDTGGTNIVTLDNAGTVTITSKTKIVLNAPEIELNGLLAQGSYAGSGGTVTLIGPLNVTNDVKSGTISVQGHLHGGVQSGASNTGAPVSGT